MTMLISTIVINFKLEKIQTTLNLSELYENTTVLGYV